MLICYDGKCEINKSQDNNIEIPFKKGKWLSLTSLVKHFNFGNKAFTWAILNCDRHICVSKDRDAVIGDIHDDAT